MRHRISGRKLGRTTSHRMAMLRNMLTSLFEHERIRTTDAKAKELRRLADKMITLAKRGDLHARRQATSVVRSREVARKLFTELADRYQSVAGGYSRVIKLGPRRGDGAMISLVELVTPQKGTPARKRSGAKQTPSKAGIKKAAKPSARLTSKKSLKTPKEPSREKPLKSSIKATAKKSREGPEKKSTKSPTGPSSEADAGNKATGSSGRARGEIPKKNDTEGS